MRADGSIHRASGAVERRRSVLAKQTRIQKTTVSYKKSHTSFNQEPVENASLRIHRES
jgi:hypothetical protein